MSFCDWDYVYQKFRDVAEKLEKSEHSLRRAMAEDVGKLADAMYAIEQFDDCNYGPGDEIEAIQTFLGHDWAQKQTRVLVEDAKKTIDELKGLIEVMDK